uniref:C2H2-type domain-containing protein n=1 Tax=Globodera rostochiensis TaxID=31243 RepID=A0A914GSV7_GLORO
MGRKKKKPQKPWCWYCNREFEDEKILIQHQKAKHFKCHICNKKLFTGPGLAIHCMQVHKESIDKIPGALPGRDNVNIEVYGMEGLPPESTRGYVDDEATDVPPSKIPRPAGPGIPLPGMMPPGHPMAAFNQFMPHAPAPYGMPPHGLLFVARCLEKKGNGVMGVIGSADRRRREKF